MRSRTEAGGTLDDIVSVVVYTTDVRQFKEVVAARMEFFVGKLPTSTIVEVNHLPDPGLLIEFQAAPRFDPEGALCVRSCLLFFRFLPLCGESHHFYALGFETLEIHWFSTLDSSVYIGAADFPS